MAEISEGGATTEWVVRWPSIIETGYWNDVVYWDDSQEWNDTPIWASATAPTDPGWSTIHTGDRTDEV